MFQLSSQLASHARLKKLSMKIKLQQNPIWNKTQNGTKPILWQNSNCNTTPIMLSIWLRATQQPDEMNWEQPVICKFVLQNIYKTKFCMSGNIYSIELIMYFQMYELFGTMDILLKCGFYWTCLLCFSCWFQICFTFE